jgi:putative lipoprotein
MKSFARRSSTVGLILLAASWTGCALNPFSSGRENVVEGTVTYRERIALPPLALVEVKLLDPASNEPSEYVAATTVRTEGRQVPISFELPYDPNKILAEHTYVVRAAIRDADETLFTTNTIHPVITKGNPKKVELVLTKVGGAEATSALVGTSWKLQDLQGERVLGGVEATLNFPEVGMVAGNATCNRFIGTVKIEGGSMKFGSIGSTKMACADSVMSQESKYLAALHNVERFTIQEPDHILLLEAEQADGLLRFRRTSP